MPWGDVGPAQERSAQRHRHERRGGLQRQSQWWPTAEPRTGHGVRTKRLSETGGGAPGSPATDRVPWFFSHTFRPATQPRAIRPSTQSHIANKQPSRLERTVMAAGRLLGCTILGWTAVSGQTDRRDLCSGNRASIARDREFAYSRAPHVHLRE